MRMFSFFAVALFFYTTTKIQIYPHHPTYVLHGVQEFPGSIHLVDEFLVEPHFDAGIPDGQATYSGEGQLHVLFPADPPGHCTKDFPYTVLHSVSVKRALK